MTLRDVALRENCNTYGLTVEFKHCKGRKTEYIFSHQSLVSEPRDGVEHPGLLLRVKGIDRAEAFFSGYVAGRDIKTLECREVHNYPED